jgi:M6 family metalloprotease-like protein
LNAYYNRSSYGLLNLSGGSTLGWYNAGSRSSVDENYTGREALIKNAINSFDTAGHDFSQYDNNGDGVIDYFGVIWTGPHGDWSSFWWGYQTSFSDDTYTVDGKQLGKYSWQWESYNYPDASFDPLVLIHETGHALGLPDYYDYDDSVGPQGGVGGLDMMHGNWGDHNAFSKFVLDWLNPDVISTVGTYPGQTLSSSASSADALLVMPNASGSPFEEFFMVQHRKREKNDAEIPTDGLLIWHVDARLNLDGWDYLYDNSYTDHKLLRLMEADGLEEIEQNLSANEGDFYIAGNSLTQSSSPNSNAYSGLATGVQVTNIAAAAGNDMTFDAALLNVPSISITSPAPLSAVSGSVSIAAEASGGSGGIAQVEFFVNNSSIGTDTTAPYSVIWDASAQASGKYHLKAVVKDGSGNENFAQESVYVATGSSKVLIIDLASDNKSGESIGAALAKNNVKPVHRNMIGDVVDPSSYQAVFVCLGYAKENHILTDEESLVLSTYLDNGGMLYLEGGDTWFWDPKKAVHAYFGIDSSEGGDFDLASVSGSGIVEGISFATSGSYAWVDHLTPVNGATAIWQNSNPAYTVGVSNQTATYRTIGCSFEFGNIPDANRLAVMTRYLSFFGISIPSNTNFLPAVFKLLL